MPIVIVRGGFNSEGDCVVSAGVKGAEWGTPEYDAHYGYTEANHFDEAYAYVVAEAGLAGFASAWEDLSFVREGRIIGSFAIEVSVA
jgi:hypothetical protein